MTKKQKSNNFVILANAGIHRSLTILLLLTFLIFPHMISAAGYGLSIYPPLLRVNIKPGKTISQVFKIDNLTSDDKFFVARLVPFSDSDLFGNPILNLKSTATWLSYFSLSNSNIKFDTPFLIKGTSSEQLILSLNVPGNAPVRDIYATLLVSTYSNSTGANFQGSQVSATTGSNMLITISADAYPATLLHVEEITPIQGWIFKIGGYYFADNITPTVFSVSALNSGDFALETKGIFKVTGWKDEPVRLEGVLPVNIISKTRRQLLSTGGENFTFTPTLGNLGPHKVIVIIKTDNANAENSINIFFLPFKVSIGLFFAVIFLIIISRTMKTQSLPIDTE